MIEEFKKAIAQTLKSAFPTHFIYTEQVQQGLKRPSFFITMIPVSVKHLSEQVTDYSCMCDIRFLSEGETASEAHQMASQLAEMFFKLVTPTDTYTLKNNRYTLVDNELHYLFDIDFRLVKAEDTSGYDTVQDVEIKIEQGDET